MHIKILNLHAQHTNLYDDMLLAQGGPMLQLHFDGLHLVIYPIQHINIITYRYHHDDLIAYNDLIMHIEPTINA